MRRDLEDDVIRLRALDLEDLDVLYAIENNTAEWRNAATSTPYSKHILRKYIEETNNDFLTERQLRLAVELKANGEIVGIIDVYDYELLSGRAEVGVYISSSHRRKGYASGALRLLSHHLRKYFRTHQLYAYVLSDNLSALRLFEAAGFQKGGILKDWFVRAGAYVDAYLLQRILDER